MNNRVEFFLSKIHVTETNLRKDHYFTAYCPICGHDEQATVLGSAKVAKVAAKSKILTHARLKHKDVDFGTDAPADEDGIAKDAPILEGNL